MRARSPRRAARASSSGAIGVSPTSVPARDLGVELPAFAHRTLLFSAHRGARDLVEEFAQQTVRHRGRAAQQAAELGVELVHRRFTAGSGCSPPWIRAS